MPAVARCTAVTFDSELGSHFTSKIIGISDGDILTALQGKTQEYSDSSPTTS